MEKDNLKEYAPIMMELAENGVGCLLLETSYNMVKQCPISFLNRTIPTRQSLL